MRGGDDRVGEAVLARAGRRFIRRRHLDDVLDWLRFRLDTFPRSGSLLGRRSWVRYQPLPWLDVDTGQRAEATYSRWRAICPLVRDAQSALDLGCNAGFFTVSLALRGIPTLGVESHPSSYRTALFAIKKIPLTNAGVLAMQLRPENVRLLPSADVVLCLSLWHHFVRDYGLDAASEMLQTIWERALRILFFETAESTEPLPSSRLPPMTPEPRTWIDRYLREICAGADITHLGAYPAVSGDRRGLFAVTRA